MPRVIRPQIQPQTGSPQISLGLAAQSGAGARAIGEAVRQVGREFAQSNQAAISARIGNTVSQFGQQMFNNSLSGQTGQVSNSLASATLAFQKAQGDRINQRTDDDGNPLYKTLVDDIGAIGNQVLQDESSKISDPITREKFQSRFMNHVTNQQVLGLGKARNQEVEFERAGLQNGLKALMIQGSTDTYANVNSYVNQGQELLDDALQAGVISPSDHAAQTEEFVSLTREAGLANTIRTDRVEAKQILSLSAEALGIDQEQHTRLNQVVDAAITSDKIQAAKASDMQAVDHEAQKADLAQKMDMRIQADALREDELILQKKNLEPTTYKTLVSKMKKRSRESAKERASLQKVSNIIAKGGDLSQATSGEVDKHYRFMVESKIAKTNQPVTLADKAAVAAQYPGKVNTFARELNSVMQTGNANQAADAVAAYTFIRDRGARALEGSMFTKKSALIAESAEMLNQQGGIPLPKAIATVRENITNSTPDLRKETNTEFNKIPDFKISNLKSTVAEQFDAENLIGINYDIDNEAAKTYKELARESYLINRDEDMAKASAANMMKFNYGVSSVNGDKSFMQAPPEKIFNMPSDAIRAQLVSDTAGILPEGIPSEQLRIRADQLTRGTFIQGAEGRTEAITYSVTYIDTASGLELPLLDDNGELQRWNPDQQGDRIEQATSAVEAARETREQDEIRRGKLGTDVFQEGVTKKPQASGSTARSRVDSGNVKPGDVSAKYESGSSGPGTVSSGKGDPGGKSYGTHQLASKTGTLQKYLQTSKFKKEFEGLKPGSAEFDKKWKEIAKRDPEAFEDDQKKFIKKTHFDPVRSTATRVGLKSTRAINEALWSIGVQHGRAKTIVSDAAKALPKGASEEDTVRQLYKSRTEYVQGLKLPAATKKSVLNRYKNELKDVLRLIK